MTLIDAGWCVDSLETLMAASPSLAMIGQTEILIILAIVVILFGARKLPELAKAMGSSITQFKRGLKDGEETEREKLERPPREAEKDPI
jgi:sec-independent protein translocase protein TatA